MPKRILYVTEDHSLDNTGVTSALDALARQLASHFDQEILAVGEGSIEPPPGVELFTLRTAGLRRVWRVPSAAGKALRNAVRHADIVHAHGVWMWPQWAAAREAHRQGKPFIFTAHGMLERWTFERQSWPHRLKKALYGRGLAYPAFRHAALLHALTPVEAATLRGYFPGGEIITLPNGIALDEIDTALRALPPKDESALPCFFFLGRLHPVKGIHLLIQAFAQLERTDFRLVIDGPTQPREAAYAAGLPLLAEQLGVSKRVQFTGRVDGAAKWQLYRDAWAFCLPTFSEVISLVNLEAAACGTPVLTTPQSEVPADWEVHGGLLFPPDVKSIAAALRRAAAWTPAERQGRAASLRRLVEREYDWQAVRPRWVEVCEGVLARSKID